MAISCDAQISVSVKYVTAGGMVEMAETRVTLYEMCGYYGGAQNGGAPIQGLCLSTPMSNASSRPP